MNVPPAGRPEAPNTAGRTPPVNAREHALEVYRRADMLYSRTQVEEALDRLAGEITAAFEDQDPLLLSIMLGGLVPTGKLLARLAFPLQVNYVHATRYDRSTSGGDLRWVAKPDRDLRDRVVLLIDDILDEGHTLSAIHRACVDMGAARVQSAVLVEKRHGRKADYKADFVGLEVEDRYVFGYGMDYKEYLRNAPGIFAVADDG